MEPVRWGPERQKAFQAMKGALASAPALGLLDYSKSFQLFVHENKGVASRVLTQKLDPHRCPVAYHSTQLDPVAAGNNSCVRAIAATATIIESSRPLVLGHPTTVYVPHEVELILKQHTTQALSPQRAHRCELTILSADNVTLKRCNVLNPATLLRVPSDGELHHGYAKVVFHSSRLQEDLRDQPLENLDLTLFTDDRHTTAHGYAVVRNLEVLEAEPLQLSVSAQGAELTASARAAWWGCNQRVTTYTDSKFAFGVCHAMGMLWKG